MSLPQSLNKLIYELQKLPGIGPKSAQRLAIFIFKKGKDFANSLSKAIIDVSENLRYCIKCHGISETEICSICNDPLRNQNIICVVEKPLDIFQIEECKVYNGLYHVLNGLISPLDQITVDKLNIKSLIDKIENNTQPINEIIFALPPKVEGEATFLLIKKMINKPIIISRLAQGIPTGCELESIDTITLAKALSNRQ